MRCEVVVSGLFGCAVFDDTFRDSAVLGSRKSTLGNSFEDLEHFGPPRGAVRNRRRRNRRRQDAQLKGSELKYLDRYVCE